MRETWEEARALGVEPDPLDGIYYANQPELNAQFPGMGFGRRFFDVPPRLLFDDPCLLQLLDPPAVVEVLESICGVELGGIPEQVRLLPPSPPPPTSA